MENKYKDSTVEYFLEELQQFSDEDLIDEGTECKFIVYQMDPFSDYGRTLLFRESDILEKDSMIVELGWNMSGTKVSELKRVLAPIVSARPDFFVRVGGILKRVHVFVPNLLPSMLLVM